MDLTKAKLWFVALSMVTMILFVVTVVKEEDREWKKWQKEFFAMEQERGIDRDYTIKLRQIYNPEAGRTDRCITCHLGMEDTDVSNPYKSNPFKSHPAVDMLKKHPTNKMGCTVCHDGQGLASDTKSAHGRVHAWDYPMHEKIGGVDFVYSSCAKCHGLDALPEGTELLVAGRKLWDKYGCFGCHTIKGMDNADGISCPDLTGIGSKTESQFSNTHSFAHVDDRHGDGHFTTKFEWLYQHFLDPAKITPGDPHTGTPPTAMPNLQMTETNARIMTLFVMSLKDQAAENLPSHWISKSKGKYSIIKK